MGSGSAVDYESNQLVAEYLHFHYAASDEYLPWGDGLQFALDYPARLVSERFPKERAARGLDIGCAVGRSSFEMSRWCEEVIGIDNSGAFISAADKIRANGKLSYQMKLQGDRLRNFTATLPSGVDPEKVSFETGDAHSLPDRLGRFDWVLGANLLCRLHHPRQFLKRLKSLLNPGGWLVLNSPFTWMEEHTQKAEWIGARENGQDSGSELKELLRDDFDFVDETNMPFLIRETERKYQITFAHSGRWRRKET